jgi:hypothetical protein
MSAVSHLGYFPFCNVAAPNHVFIEMPLETAIAVWWRVKVWQVDVGTFDYDDGGGGRVYFDIAGPQTLSPPANPVEERNLVCPIERTAGYYSGFEGTGPFCELSIAPSVVLLPEDRAGLAMRIMLGTSRASEESWISTYEDGVVVGGGTLLVLGQEVTFTLRNTEAVLPDVLNVDFQISPAEFWPYDPGDDGGPIYGQFTGEALRDPHNP